MLFGKGFWGKEDLRLYTATERIILQLFMRGGFDGEMDLKPSGADSLVDWDVLNMDAIRYLQSVHKDIIHMINETTQKTVYPLIEDWMRSGEPLPKLIKTLRGVKGEGGSYIFSKNRAKRIGVTEVTRAFNSGKLKAWQSTNYVTAKQWTTARDDRVCPICSKLDGKIVATSINFSLGPDDLKGEDDPLAKLLKKSGGGLTYMMPPAHTNCRCGLRPIVDIDVIRNEEIVNLD